MTLILIIFILLFLLSGGVGYYGHTASWGPAGWVPLAAVIVLLVILLSRGDFN
jgi:predicted ABC-type exoprotein transport system permease subunit